MTDPSASPDDLELASAYLDGEVTPEERARVDGDARLRALAADLARVQTALRLDDPPPELADEHVSAALAASEAPVGERGVADLGAERRRRRWSERLPLGAVAAVVLLVALVGALSTIDTNDDDRAETAADRATDDASSGAADGADEAGEASTTAAAETFDAAEDAAPAPSGARLEFSTYDDLADHVATTVLTRASDGTAGAGTGGSVDDAPDTDADDGEGTANDEVRTCDAAEAAGVDDPVAVVDATVDGQEVTAFVVDGADGRRLLVVDRATCAVVDDRELSG